jgi:osmotically-inducible protein OsmY
MTRDEVPQYVAGRIQQRLAEDPRTAELGIKIEVRGDVVYLRGRIMSEERRSAIVAVVREAEPEREIRDEIGVTSVHEPEEEEEPS